MLLKLLSQAFSSRSKDAPEDADPAAPYLAADGLLRAERPREALPLLRGALQREFAPAARDDAKLLRALIETVWMAPPQRWSQRMTAFEQYGWLVDVCGALRDPGSEARRAALHDPASVPAEHARRAADATLRLLNFRRGSHRARIEALMSDLVLPWMKRAADSGRFGLALMLEKQAYSVYVVGTESEQHFSRAFALWSDFMREAGGRSGQQLTPLSRPRNQPPRVAFYLHSGNLMAHTRVLFDFLDALRELQPAPLAPLVFHRGPASPELASRAAAAGVQCRGLDAHAQGGMGDDYEALLELRRQMTTERLDALVWISIALHMGFAFSMRVAPVQLWWALKYHGVGYPEIDGRFTSGSAGSSKSIGGELWRSAPLGSLDWYDPAQADEARKIRERHARHEVLLACIGREEKLNSEPFLSALAAVLRACPQAGFLWTGRERLTAIQSRLQALGVAERCHYVGWVDTKLYAQVMDVFLDSFPFPCAFTLYEAMAAGKPVLTYASPEAAETGLHGLLAPLLAGESGSPEEQARARELFGDSLYLCAHSPQAYVETAIRLVRDAQLRRAAGAANRRFVAEFLSDPGRTAHTLATHLVELIAQAQARA